MSEYDALINKFIARNDADLYAASLFVRASSLARKRGRSASNAVTATAVEAYLHQAQVVLVYSSTYLFNQMRKLFDTLYLALHPDNPSRKARKILEEWGIDLREWSFDGRTEIDGKTVYAVTNKKYRIVLYSRSLDKNMPVAVTFLDDRAWGKNNTITFSKIFNSVSKERIVDEKTGDSLIDMNGRCLVTLNFAGYVLDYRSLLERLKPILPSSKKFDFEKGLIKIRYVRQELYVRYNPEKEFDVKKMIDELHLRYGVETFVDMQKNVELQDEDKNKEKDNGIGKENNEDSKEKEKGDGGIVKRVQYLASARLVLALPNAHKLLNGRQNNTDRLVKLYVKTYRREKFKSPAEDYADWPKAEIAVYFCENDSFDEVKRKIEFAGSLLASLVRSLDLEVEYVDMYQILVFVPDPALFRFFKGELALRNLNELELSKIQRRFLEELVERALTSDDIKKLADEFDVTERTVQRHVRQLEEMGWVLKVRTKVNGKANQYVYLLNLSAVQGDNLVIVVSGDAQLDAFINAAKRDESVPSEVKKNSRLLLTWYLVAQGFKTSKAIAKKLVRYGVFVTDRTVRNYLARLQQYGLVEQVGSGPHTVYRAKYIIVT